MDPARIRESLQKTLERERPALKLTAGQRKFMLNRWLTAGRNPKLPKA